MIKTNPILSNMCLVKIRAAQLNCTVQAVLGNVILCNRNSDDTFITWRCHVYDNSKVEFISGCYDMTELTGWLNFMDRACEGKGL